MACKTQAISQSKNDNLDPTSMIPRKGPSLGLDNPEETGLSEIA